MTNETAVRDSEAVGSAIEEIRQRLYKAPSGVWDCDGFSDGEVTNLTIYEGTNQGPIVAEGIKSQELAAFLMNCREDIAYLLLLADS